MVWRRSVGTVKWDNSSLELWAGAGSCGMYLGRCGWDWGLGNYVMGAGTGELGLKRVRGNII